MDFFHSTSGKSSTSGNILKNYEFDFSLGGSSSKGQSLGSLKEQKSSQGPETKQSEMPSPSSSAHVSATWSSASNGIDSIPIQSSATGMSPGLGSNPSWSPLPSAKSSSFATSPKKPWSHTPASSSHLSSSSSWAQNPAAQAGLVGSVTKNDSLADLWKTTTKKVDNNPLLGQKKASSQPFQPQTSPASASTLRGASSAATGAKGNSIDFDLFGSLTEAKPSSMGLKQAKESGASFGVEAPKPSKVLPPVDAMGTQSVKFNTETVTVQSVDVQGDPFSGMAGAGVPLGTTAPFDDPFGGIAPTTNTLGGTAGFGDPFGGTGTPTEPLGGTAGFSDPFAGAGVPSETTSFSDPFHGTGTLNEASGGAGAMSDPFGDFFGAPTAPVPSQTTSTSFDPFPTTAAPSDPLASSFDAFSGTRSVGGMQADPFFGSSSNVDQFDAVFGASASAKGKPAASVDPLEDLLLKSKPSSFQPAQEPQFASGFDSSSLEAPEGGDGWGDFQESGETTTELRDVGGAPLGVTAESALKKGVEFFRGGQFADAIKWFVWAEQLCVDGGDEAKLVEVLTNRSTCYKEAGEMKLAIADCSKVIDMLPTNTVILMQRARLYEATEKYKAGVQDLKLVTQLDPSNRQAVAMLVRMNKALANN